MGAKNCLRGAKFFKLGPRHFSRGGKNSTGFRPPAPLMVTGLILHDKNIEKMLNNVVDTETLSNKGNMNPLKICRLVTEM